MRKGSKCLKAALIGLGIVLSGDASAQSESVFERVSEAYQVERLIAAETIRLEEEHRSEFANHDYGPDFHETSYQRRHYVLDLQNERGSREWVADIASTFFHTRRIVEGGKNVLIIYGPSVYQADAEVGFFAQFGGAIRASDPMLALWLVQSAETARIENDEVWMGRVHDRVTVDFPGSPPLTILVDKETGYVSKMTRLVGGRTKVSYTFDRHELQDGIPIATENYVYAGRDMLVYSFGNRIVLDDPFDRAAFDIDPDIVPQPERIDQSIETIDEISASVYHTGQDATYSTFVKTTDGLVAYGLTRGFSDRLEMYRSKSGDNAPLKYGVVPDHHQIELQGVADAVQAGATLLITNDAQERTREAIQQLGDVTVEIVSTVREIGTLKLIPVSTSHASQALVGYESAGQILIQQGHWVKWFETEPVWADISDLTLLQAIEPYNLPIESILSTDGRGLGDWAVFVSQVEKYQPIACHRNRPICENWR